MSLINDILVILSHQNKKQSDLCRAIGITTSKMTNWKNRNTDPPAKYLIPICEFLEVSPYYLLTGKEKSPSPELTEEEHKCLEVFDRLEPEDRIRFIAKMEQRYEDYSSEFSEELTPKVEKNVS